VEWEIQSVLHVSPANSNQRKKKRVHLESVNQTLLQQLKRRVHMSGLRWLRRLKKLELKKPNLKMWVCGQEDQQVVMACNWPKHWPGFSYVFGWRKEEVFLKLKQLLERFGIKKYCPDGWEAWTASSWASWQGNKKLRGLSGIWGWERELMDPQENLLFQTRADARSSHLVVYQSLWVWAADLNNNKSRTLPVIHSPSPRTSGLGLHNGSTSRSKL